MRCHNFVLIYFLWTTLSFFAFAQEKDAEEVLTNQNYSGAQNLEWKKEQTKLSGIKGRLDMQFTIIKKLIVDKAGLSGKELAIKMAELKKEYTNLQSIMKEHDEVNIEFLTKFPERGIKESRVYKRIKPKSLQAYEADFSVQGRVDKLHEKILQQYFVTSEKSNLKNKKINKKINKNTPKVEDVTEPLLLRK